MAKASEEFETVNKEMIQLTEKIEHSSKQIKTLENMRDTLLPKFIIGEVRGKYE